MTMAKYSWAAIAATAVVTIFTSDTHADAATTPTNVVPTLSPNEFEGKWYGLRSCEGSIRGIELRNKHTSGMFEISYIRETKQGKEKLEFSVDAARIRSGWSRIRFEVESAGGTLKLGELILPHPSGDTILLSEATADLSSSESDCSPAVFVRSKRSRDDLRQAIEAFAKVPIVTEGPQFTARNPAAMEAVRAEWVARRDVCPPFLQSLQAELNADDGSHYFSTLQNYVRYDRIGGSNKPNPGYLKKRDIKVAQRKIFNLARPSVFKRITGSTFIDYSPADRQALADLALYRCHLAENPEQSAIGEHLRTILGGLSGADVPSSDDGDISIVDTAVWGIYLDELAKIGRGFDPLIIAFGPDDEKVNSVKVDEAEEILELFTLPYAIVFTTSMPNFWDRAEDQKVQMKSLRFLQIANSYAAKDAFGYLDDRNFAEFLTEYERFAEAREGRFTQEAMTRVFETANNQALDRLLDRYDEMITKKFISDSEVDLAYVNRFKDQYAVVHNWLDDTNFDRLEAKIEEVTEVVMARDMQKLAAYQASPAGQRDSAGAKQGDRFDKLNRKSSIAIGRLIQDRNFTAIEGAVGKAELAKFMGNYAVNKYEAFGACGKGSTEISYVNRTAYVRTRFGVAISGQVFESMPTTATVQSEFAKAFSGLSGKSGLRIVESRGRGAFHDFVNTFSGCNDPELVNFEASLQRAWDTLN